MKNEISFTPGPWSISERAGNYDSRVNSYAVTHGRVGNYLAIVEAIGIASLDNKANARLIAAAPDLLAVLKAGDLENWVANAALTTDIEALRAICLEWADWWNNLAVPVIDKAAGKTV